MNRVFCVTPQLAKMDEYYYGEGSLWVKSWEKALEMLVDTHGDETNVALYPTAAMQISEENASNL